MFGWLVRCHCDASGVIAASGGGQCRWHWARAAVQPAGRMPPAPGGSRPTRPRLRGRTTWGSVSRNGRDLRIHRGRGDNPRGRWASAEPRCSRPAKATAITAASIRCTSSNLPTSHWNRVGELRRAHSRLRGAGVLGVGLESRRELAGRHRHVHHLGRGRLRGDARFHLRRVPPPSASPAFLCQKRAGDE